MSRETVALRRWENITRQFSIINLVDNVDWPPLRVLRLTFLLVIRFDERLTHETSALTLLTVANLRYQLS